MTFSKIKFKKFTTKLFSKIRHISFKVVRNFIKSTTISMSISSELESSLIYNINIHIIILLELIQPDIFLMFILLRLSSELAFVSKSLANSIRTNQYCRFFFFGCKMSRLLFPYLNLKLLLLMFAKFSSSIEICVNQDRSVNS